MPASTEANRLTQVRANDSYNRRKARVEEHAHENCQAQKENTSGEIFPLRIPDHLLPIDFTSDRPSTAHPQAIMGGLFLLPILRNERLTMELPEESVLLRIFIGEQDHYHHKPLYEAIVLKAREMHLAGATVLRGPMGFGMSSRVHTAKILQLSMDLPIIVEIVDSQEKIDAFLPLLNEMMDGGLVTLERAQVIHYRHKQSPN